MNLDQFYTKKEISLDLYNKISEIINIENYFLFEPSAGTGSFSNLFHKNSLAIDLDPKSSLIIEEDFLEFNNNYFKNKKVITIGNPPFGQNSTLAVKFFNKASEYSEYIAFILPKTFKKDSFINKLNINMHLIKEVELNGKNFIYNNKEKEVKTVFQIWQKKKVKRKKIDIKKESLFFKYVKKEDADFAIRRIGDLSGKIIKKFNKYSENSHLYIQCKENINKENFYNKFDIIYKEFKEKSNEVAGTPSISKSEIIKIYERIYNDKIKEIL